MKSFFKAVLKFLVIVLKTFGIILLVLLVAPLLLQQFGISPRYSGAISMFVFLVWLVRSRKSFLETFLKYFGIIWKAFGIIILFSIAPSLFISLFILFGIPYGYGAVIGVIISIGLIIWRVRKQDRHR